MSNEATSDSNPARRKAGRPSTTVLTRERILDEAFELADRRGGDFSVAAIARGLGVQPPAIYNYFASKADIISGMRGAIGHRVDPTVFERMPWHEAVLPWARDYLEAVGHHPGIIATLATIPVDSEPQSMREYEMIANSFRRDNYPEHRIVPALVAIESFIIGSALDALTPEDNLSPAAVPDLAPALFNAEATARSNAHEAGLTMARSVFEFGLAALVSGLRAVGETEREAAKKV